MNGGRTSKIRNPAVWAAVLLLLGVLHSAPTRASHKVPSGPPPFAYPVTPPEAQPVAPGIAAPATVGPSPAPAPTPAPAAEGLSLDRFAIGFLLIVVGTLGAGLAVLGLRRARRLRDVTLRDKAPPPRGP